MKSLNDYRIDTSKLDWQALFASWHWLLPATINPWIMNRFGDLIFRTEDGRVYRLLLDDGSLECVAESMDQFCAKLDDREFANKCLMIPLVDRLVEAGVAPKEGQCYSFIQLPVLGGSYGIENVTVRDILFQYAALGPIYEELKNVPDGAIVKFTVGE